MSNIPRRQMIDQQTPTERAICNAMHAVEALGADPRLTTAVTALAEAFNAVADWTDVQGSRVIPMAGVDASPGAEQRDNRKFLPGFISITDETGTFTPPVANPNYGEIPIRNKPEPVTINADMFAFIYHNVTKR